MKTSNSLRLVQTGFFFYLILLLGVSVAMMGPSLRILADQSDTNLADISTIVLMMPVGFIVGIYICRYFLNSNYIKQVIFLSLLIFGILLASVTYSSIFLLLVILFFVIAMTQGVFEVASNVFMVDINKKNPAPYLNAMHFCFGVGAIISPILIGYNIQYLNSITYSYIFFAILALPAMIVLLFMQLKPVIDEVDEVKKTSNPNYLMILIGIHVFFFLYIFLEAGYSISIFPYLRQQDLLSPASSGLFAALFWGMFTFFRLIGTLLSIYFHPLKIVLGHALVGLVGLPLMLLAGDQVFLLWIGNIIMGASLSVFFPCMLAYCETDLKIPSKSVSHFFVSATGGAMIGSWFLVRLLDIKPSLIFYPLILATILIPLIIIIMARLKQSVATAK